MKPGDKAAPTQTGARFSPRTNSYNAAVKSSLPKDQVRKYLSAGLSLIRASRRVILRKIASGYSIDTKADKSYVTGADLAAEKTLRSGIAKRFPEHGILGEEFPAKNPGADFQWIIDPIDGTLSFTRGIPLYGTILALHHEGRPVVGIIDHPSLDLVFSAGAGLGAFRNGRRLRMAREAPGIADEIVATGDRAHFIKSGKEKAFDALVRRHPQVRSYSDCFGHTLAAAGAVGAMVDFGVRLWDISATELLITEAGGKYVVAQRLEKSGTGTLYGVICGKPRVVDWLLPIFS